MKVIIFFSKRKHFYKMLRILSSGNAMKGSLSARLASEAMSQGAESAIQHFKLNYPKFSDFKYSIATQAIADGGDDTLEVLSDVRYVDTVNDPFKRSIKSEWGSRGDTAIIEMAKASGIALCDDNELNPFKSTTYGTGELILKAIHKGFRNIMITIGGSATCDGGIGALAALGGKFYDKNNKVISPFGNEAAGKVRKVDLKNVYNIMKGIHLEIACDVDNPLLGKNGSIYTFGKQKCNRDTQNNKTKLNEVLQEMENNLKNYAYVIQKETKRNVLNLAGCGAAGGFPLSFCPTVNAKLEKGSSLVLKVLDFKKYKGYDLVFTCEGKCDEQTLHGKGPFALIDMLKDSHIVFLCGAIESEEVEKQMLSSGASVVSAINNGPTTLQESMKSTFALLRNSSFRHSYSYLKAKYIK